MRVVLRKVGAHRAADFQVCHCQGRGPSDDFAPLDVQANIARKHLIFA
jgi:hypothetical protein